MDTANLTFENYKITGTLSAMLPADSDLTASDSQHFLALCIAIRRWFQDGSPRIWRDTEDLAHALRQCGMEHSFALQAASQALNLNEDQHRRLAKWVREVCLTN